jgi:tRNA-Thr(GGU) m(6)t(6)A37 methyltransferase TsaA
METISYRPIGVIHSPFREPQGMPIQPAAAGGAEGAVEIFPEFRDGLKDLEGFSHLVLIYHLHLSQGFSLLVKPFLDDEPRGVFATRAPRRPNAIGLSVVRLVAIDSTTLRVRELDIVDGTPLLDLKPYIPEANPKGPYSLGWLEGKTRELSSARSDDRFKA